MEIFILKTKKVCYDFKEILSFSSKRIIFFGSDKILILHPFKAAVYLNYRGKVVKKPIKIPTYQWEWGGGIDVCRSSFRYDIRICILDISSERKFDHSWFELLQNKEALEIVFCFSNRSKTNKNIFFPLVFMYHPSKIRGLCLMKCSI